MTPHPRLRVTWARTPQRVEYPEQTQTVVVHFELLNATRVAEGAAPPHTFRLAEAGLVVADRRPDDVLWDAKVRRWLGRWTLSLRRWAAEPRSVARRDYETVLAVFPADTSGKGRSLPEALRAAPHTFRLTLEGVAEPVDVVNRPPHDVLNDREAGWCGLWIVTSPLSSPQWSAAPLAPVHRPWRDRDHLVVEYEFFAPARAPTDTDWVTVAGRTPHTFPLKPGRTVRDQPPTEVLVRARGRIVGRWRVPDKYIQREDYTSPEPCGQLTVSPAEALFWLVVVALVSGLLTYAACRPRP